jgi:hypothetical protein
VYAASNCSFIFILRNHCLISPCNKTLLTPRFAEDSGQRRGFCDRGR